VTIAEWYWLNRCKPMVPDFYPRLIGKI